MPEAREKRKNQILSERIVSKNLKICKNLYRLYLSFNYSQTQHSQIRGQNT